MTEEIINADGSRNWEANILLDNIKRLEFELKVTKADYEASEQENKELKQKIKKYSAINEQDTKDYAILRNALEEIKVIAKDIIENDVYENSDVKAENILTKINEVLQ